MFWTKEKVTLTAKKYSTLSQFKHNSKNAYKIAVSNNWLEDISKHMKPDKKKWDKITIINLAKNFSSIRDFRQKEGSAYVTAKNNGWLKEVTEHMKPLHISWTDEMIILEARKYKTRREFEVNSESACQIARLRKIMDVACSHMDRVGNYLKRLVYSYEFPDNSVYIGLTYNKNTRHNDHTSKTKSPVYKKIKQLNFEPKMIIISDSYIDSEEARILEEQTVFSYREKGWEILNKVKAGGLGGTKTKGEKLFLDKDSCHKEALKYSTQKEFREGSPYAYSRAYDLQCLKEIVGHMKVRSLSYEECKNEAKKFKRISDFKGKAARYYARAYKMGWVSEICDHMKLNKKWNEEIVTIDAKKYTSRSEFHKKSPLAYAYASNYKLLDKICSHMKPLLIKWTKEMVEKEISKYTSLKDFRHNSSKAYEASRSNGWGDLYLHLYKKSKTIK